MEAVVRLARTRFSPLIIVAGTIAILYGVRNITYAHPMYAPQMFQDFMTFAGSILIESLPFVLLGIFLSVAVQVWLPANVMTRLLPERGWLRRLYISCFGVFLPVCECGNLPLARGLIAGGLKPAESLTFLLAAPILNPITLITTHQAFPADIRILLARAFGALIIANIVGWIFSKHHKQEELLTLEFAAACAAPDPHTHGKVERSLQLFNKETAAILPALCIGAIIAGAVQVLVPRSVLLGVGGSATLSIIVMMTLAFVVAICSNVDAFFALAFSTTFSVGSIVSFLVFGPMIDIKMLSLMRTTYRPKVLMQVSLLVALMSLAIGLGVNYAF
ncbi:MAG TPA: permease [Candidatus Saccharimonadales bacterium]|jgi:uncharacterized membrane protein YraQ (UPF0718 family)|nr:permease [Candidatus Saccharimonadales bacterium]